MNQQNITKNLPHEGEALRQAIENASAANRTSPKQPQQVHQQQSQQQAQQQQLQQPVQQPVQQAQAGANLAYLVLPDGRQALVLLNGSQIAPVNAETVTDGNNAHNNEPVQVQERKDLNDGQNQPSGTGE